MHVLIVEDEAVAARSLERLLIECDTSIVILEKLNSIKDAVHFFAQATSPEIIFLDIHLADGNAFSLFEQADIKSKVVFTTAYSDYAVRAFELNSLDYLLKPISKQRLQQTLQRHKEQAALLQPGLISSLKQVVDQMSRKEQSMPYKTRFLVKSGSRLLTITIDQVSYFYRNDTLITMVLNDQKRYVVSHTLEELEAVLDPRQFFRLNRQVIARHAALAGINTYFKSKLKVELTPPLDSPVIVSQERSNEFKKWLEGEAEGKQGH